MPNQKNIEQVNEITAHLQESAGVVFLDYQGLSARQVEELRNSIEEVGGSLTIVKNTLLNIALRQSGMLVDGETPEELIQPTAALYLGEDIISPLKKLSEFIKANTLPHVKGGVIESHYVRAEKVIEISKLPTYDVLIAQLLGQLQAPVQGLVSVLSGINRNLVYVLDQIKQSKGGDQ